MGRRMPSHSAPLGDRIFPIVALGLVAILTVGLVGVGGYVLLGQRRSSPPTAQAMNPTANPTGTAGLPSPTAVVSDTPTAPPTHTRVSPTTSTSQGVPTEVATAITPLPTPVLLSSVLTSTPALESPAAAAGAGDVVSVPTTGFGVLSTATLGLLLASLLLGARMLTARGRR
jgi:hypothetical protein